MHERAYSHALYFLQREILMAAASVIWLAVIYGPRSRARPSWLSCDNMVAVIYLAWLSGRLSGPRP